MEKIYLDFKIHPVKIKELKILATILYAIFEIHNSPLSSHILNRAFKYKNIYRHHSQSLSPSLLGLGLVGLEFLLKKVVFVKFFRECEDNSQHQSNTMTQ